MAIKLSHSGANQFMTCARKYKYHYIEKYREKTNSAALLWGSAIDEALNSMLMDHAKRRVDYLCQEYDNVFMGKWRKSFINKVPVELMNSELITYAAADFDADLIPEADYNVMVSLSGPGNVYAGLSEFTPRGTDDVLVIMKSILKAKEEKGWDNLTSQQRRFYNHLNWLSLAFKAKLLLRRYIVEILPKIKRVLAVQKQITLLNDEGDEITGFVDAVVEWEDGRIIVIDNKTSAREYEWNAVQESIQLALYVHALQDEFKTRTAGFIVLRKAIHKNRTKVCSVCKHNGTGGSHKTCDNEVDGVKIVRKVEVAAKVRCNGAWIENIRPEAEINVLLADIPERVEEIVLENLADMTYLIKQGIFPRSLNACDRPFPCPFKGICFKDNYDDVICVKKEGE